jgi:hypothetical protein
MIGKPFLLGSIPVAILLWRFVVSAPEGWGACAGIISMVVYLPLTFIFGIVSLPVWELAAFLVRYARDEHRQAPRQLLRQWWRERREGWSEDIQIDYVRRARAEGASDAAITGALLGAGWSEGEARQAFALATQGPTAGG